MNKPWSIGDLDGNWIDIDHEDHGGVIRMVWNMEGNVRTPSCEKLVNEVVDALNFAASMDKHLFKICS